MYLNRDDNIHKSEALKRKDKQTLTIVECQKLIIRIQMYRRNVSKFVVNQEQLTFLGIDYRNALLII